MKKVLLALVLLITFASCGYAKTRQSPAYKAASTLVTCVLLGLGSLVRNYFKNKHKPKSQNFTYDTFTETTSKTDAKHTIATPLVCLGLACIGRKSQFFNPYLTPEREDIRHKAEYSFLRQLAQKYHDADARKVLAKHFMLYKEMLLSLTFSILLKKDAELHDLVKKELSIWLTKGLYMASAVKRKEYMYEFSKAFYDEYKRTKNLELTLNYSFWQVAAERYPDIVSPAELSTLMRFSGLFDIYKHIHMTLKKEI